MEFDMDKAIADTKKSLKEGETMAFGLGAGRMLPVFGNPKIKKAMKKTIDYIKSMDGFLGVHPVDLWHTLLIFDTLNNAKAARNELKAKECPIGQVVPIVILEEFNKKGE